MKKAKRGLRFGLIATCACLLIMTVACNGNKGNTSEPSGQASPSASSSNSVDTGDASATPEKKEPVTLKLLSVGPASTWNDHSDSVIQQEIKDKLGITLEIETVDEGKFNVTLAGGDLPDIIGVNNPKYFKQLIDGGNVIPMDELLQSNGQELLKTIPKTLALSKANWSEGRNQTYFLPPQVGKEAMPIEDGLGPVLRWDYYKEIGAPAINSVDDLLNAIAEMQKKHPTTDDGKKVYGVSGFLDYGNWSYFYSMAAILGYQMYSPTLAYSVDNEGMNNMTNAESPFWKGVELFYKAHKLGILDPDFLTMKLNDYSAKATAGQVLYGQAGWAMGDFNSKHANDGQGYMTIPLDFGDQWHGATWNAGWEAFSMAITKDSKHADRVMDLFNYLWSYEGARTMYSGVQGKQWDTVDGKPQLKPETVALKKAGGDEWTKTQIQYSYQLIGLSPFTVNPDDGLPLSLFETTEMYTQVLTPLQKDFSDYYGVQYPSEIFKKKLEEGKNKNQETFNAIALALMPSPPDDLKRKEAKFNDLSAQYAAKAVLAKSDEQFKAAVNDGIEALKKAGAEEVGNWYLNAWEEAKKQSAQY